MLIKRAVLDQVVAGDIDVIFRRWRKPTVKTGGQLRTSVGMLDIVAVDQLARSKVTAADARRAGYDSKVDLLRDLDSRDAGEIYRITVRHGGEDPRLLLRENSDIDDDALTEIRRKLDGYDARSSRGPWTMLTLQLLADNPGVRAQDLADGLGLQKQPFKNDVRKLKAMGLTISHSPGYELSPRGQAVLDRLTER